MLDDLKYQRIQPSTLVKIDDGDWKPVSEVPDLSFLVDAGYAKPGGVMNVSGQTRVPISADEQARKRVTVMLAIVILIAIMGMAAFFMVIPATR